MIKALELQNFKAFGERTRIDLAPITMIFGENSAGKSTILQALNLLKQTRESREQGALISPTSPACVPLISTHVRTALSLLKVGSSPAQAFSQSVASLSRKVASTFVIGSAVGRRPVRRTVRVRAIGP